MATEPQSTTACGKSLYVTSRFVGSISVSRALRCQWAQSVMTGISLAFFTEVCFQYFSSLFSGSVTQRLSPKLPQYVPYQTAKEGVIAWLVGI